MTIIKTESELLIIWENSLNLMQNDDTSYNYKLNPNRSNTYMFWLLTWGRYSNSWKASLYLFNAPYLVHCLCSKFTPGIQASLLTNLSFAMAYWWPLDLALGGETGCFGINCVRFACRWTGCFVINCVRFACRLYRVLCD